jgi:DNA-binding transcriptional LysR family regulator
VTSVPLDLYKVFCVVARYGSISAAAKALYITQPAVSMAVMQLERLLSRRLLIRSSKGVQTTAEGQLLHEYLEQALHLIETAEDKFQAMVDRQLGEIKIGASDTILSYYLMRHIETYTKMYPNITIKATNRTSMETVKNLRSGAVDIGFVNLPFQNDFNDDGLEIVRCLEIQDCLIGGEKYGSLAKRGLSIQELTDYPLMLLENESTTRRYINAYAEKNGVSFSPVIELGSSDLLVRFTRINLGLAFVIRGFTQEELDGENLFEIPLSPEIAPRHVGLVKLKGVSPSCAVEDFVNMIMNSSMDS